MKVEDKGLFKLLYFIGFFLIIFLYAFIQKLDYKFEDIFNLVVMFYFLLGGILGIVFKIPVFSKWKWFSDYEYSVEDTIRIIFAMVFPVILLVGYIISLLNYLRL